MSGPSDEPSDEPPDDAHRERRALVVSILASAVLGFAAATWGVLVQADVLVFDGVYMLAGIGLVAVSLLASRAANAPPSARFPFGRSAATPLAVAVQGAALLAALLYGVVSAVGTILQGGSPVPATVLMVYGVASAAASWLVAVLVARTAPTSELARAEVVAWRSGAVLSIVVAVGGFVAAVLRSAGRDGLADHVDPVLVLVAVALVVHLPVRLVRDGMHELLEGAPTGTLAAALDDAVARTRAQFDLPEPTVRATKLGRRMYVEVTFVVGEHGWEVDDEDAVRRTLTARLDALPLDVWATVELTTDATFAD